MFVVSPIIKKRNFIILTITILIVLFLYFHSTPIITPTAPTNLYLLIPPSPPIPSYEHHSLVHSGIPSINDYQSISSSPHYLKMVEYSNLWLKRHSLILEPYSKTWANDPLHVGNRPWEYFYTFLRFEESLRRFSDKDIYILELGSGVTFFPFWIAQLSPKVHILAVDSDPVYASIFEKISLDEGVSNRVGFLHDNLRNTKAKKKKFDFVYCVSVLEHTANYGKISQHMKDLMNPGATVVITFSLSLDHLQDISEEKAHHLLSELNKNFCDIDPFPVSISERIRQPDPIWSVSTLDRVDKSLRKPDSDGSPLSDITVVTCTFRKCK